jgi:hypothetical protein
MTATKRRPLVENILMILIVMAVYLGLQWVILPRLGVPT